VPSPRKTFRDIYCSRHSLDPKNYQHAVLRRCLYLHAQPLWWLLGWSHPGFFQPDLELIESIAQLRSRKDFASEAADFQNHPGNRNLLKRVLRLRVSVRRLRELVDEELEYEHAHTRGEAIPADPATRES